MAPHDEDEDRANRHPPYLPPPHLPPETYNHLIHALLSLQGTASGYPPAYPPPFQPSPGPSYPRPPHAGQPVPTAPIAGPPAYYPMNPPMPPPPRAMPQAGGSSQLGPAPPASFSTAQDPEGEDAVSASEDKRRRNTAASARFRTKKKLKSLNLERSVADLTGRTDELEREAADLRRENAWLKEIVLLKGRNMSALSAERHDEGGKDESEPGSSASRRDKGKDVER